MISSTNGIYVTIPSHTVHTEICFFGVTLFVLFATNSVFPVERLRVHHLTLRILEIFMREPFAVVTEGGLVD